MAVRGVGSPVRLALVVAIGPTSAARARTNWWSGQRTPMVPGVAAEVEAGADGRAAQDDGERPRPQLGHPPADVGHGQLDQLERLVEVGHEHRQRVVGGPVLEGEQVGAWPRPARAARPGRRRCRWAGRPSRRPRARRRPRSTAAGSSMAMTGEPIGGTARNARRCTGAGRSPAPGGGGPRSAERPAGDDGAVEAGAGRGGPRRRRARPPRPGPATVGGLGGADLEHQRAAGRQPARPRRRPAPRTPPGRSGPGTSAVGGLPVGDRRRAAPRRRRRRAGW